MVDHFLVVVGHRDPEKYCATKRFSERLRRHSPGHAHHGLGELEALPEKCHPCFFLVHNSEKLVGLGDSCCIMHCKFELEVNARLGL